MIAVLVPMILKHRSLIDDGIPREHRLNWQKVLFCMMLLNQIWKQTLANEYSEKCKKGPKGPVAAHFFTNECTYKMITGAFSEAVLVADGKGVQESGLCRETYAGAATSQSCEHLFGGMDQAAHGHLTAENLQKIRRDNLVTRSLVHEMGCSAVQSTRVRKSGAIIREGEAGQIEQVLTLRRGFEAALCIYQLAFPEVGLREFWPPALGPHSGAVYFQDVEALLRWLPQPRGESKLRELVSTEQMGMVSFRAKRPVRSSREWEQLKEG
jgi:hypothetical protein